MSPSRTTLQSAEVVSGIVLAVSIAAACVLGRTVALTPGFAVLAAGSIAALLAAIRFPAVTLAIGVFASLLHPAATRVATIAGPVIVLTGVVCVLKIIREARPALPRAVLGMSAALLALMFISIGTAQSMQDALPFLSCAFAVLATVYAAQRPAQLLSSLRWAALVFVLGSTALGTYDDTGMRFAGLSGNPNRMVLGMLLAIPLFADGMRGSLARRVGWGAAILLAARLVIMSGSDQGVVGLVIVAALGLVLITRRASGPVRLAGTLAVLFVAVLYLGFIHPFGGLDENWRTLSGRTALFESAWRDFLDQPLTGSGRLQTLADTGVERSTHDSIISFAIGGGIAALVLWVVLLLRAGVDSVVGLTRGRAAAACSLVVVVEQLVQQIESIPAAWAFLVLASALLANESRERREERLAT